MSKRKDFSIRQIITTFFISVIGLVCVSYGLVMLSNSLLRTDAARIEISRRGEKALSQLAYQTSQVMEGDREAKEELKNILTQYDDQLDILTNGRDLRILTSSSTVKATSDQEALSKLNKVKEMWRTYRKDLGVILDQTIQLDSVVESKGSEKDGIEGIEGLDSANVQVSVGATFKEIQKIKNPAVARAYNNTLDFSKKIQKAQSELTVIYMLQYIRQQTNIQIILFFAILGLLAALGLGYYYILRRFLKPLENVARVTKEVAEGDVSQKVSYDRSDEIGYLIQNINTLVNGLKQTSEFARNIGKSNFDYSFEVRSPKDSLGYALLGMRDNLLKVAEEDRRRNWANDGFTLFVNILRSNADDFNDLSYKIISNLVKYLNANQGGIYVVSEDEDGSSFLELKASFAYDKRKYQDVRLEMGQGLVGQAVVEKDTLHLDKIPEGYIQVTSGLGDSNPRNLLIVPLIENNQVYGAVEIASFNHFQQYEIEFVEQLSENIASTFAAVKTTEKTRFLLEESQMVTEQMKAQDEEMRQNMETLASTQMIMEKSQRELEKMKSNLEIQVKERTSELRDKETQLSEALRLAFLAPWKLDVEKKSLECNEELYRLLRTNKEIENGYMMSSERFVTEYVTPEDQEFLNERIKDAILSKDSNYEETVEYRMKRSNGEIRNAAISLKRIIDPKNPDRTQYLYGTIQDITRRKQIEEQISLQKEALEQQQIEQQKFVAMVENATDFVAMVNMQQEVIYANKVGQQLFGIQNYDENKIMMQEFFNEENWLRFQNEISPAVQNNGFWEGELELINFKTKQLTYMTGNIVAIKNSQNETTAVATILRDITDQHRVAIEMEIANIRMKSVLESTEDEIVSVDNNYNVLSFNSQWEAFIKKETGVEPQIGMNLFSDFNLREDLHSKLKEHFSKAITDGAFSVVEFFQKTEKQKIKIAGKEKEKDVVVGEYHFSRFYNPIRDTEGTVIGAVCFTKDITDQKRAEQEILKSENRLKAISNSTTEGIVLHDKGYIRDVNTAFCQMSGYAPEELIGKYLFNIFDADGKATSIINMQLGYDKPYEVVLMQKDGGEVPLEIQGRVVRFEDQRIRVFAMRDISEQRETQKRLQDSSDILQKIIDTLPQSVFWKNTESVFMGCNQKFLQTVGLESVEQVIGKTDFDIWNAPEAEYYVMTDKKVLESGVPELDVQQQQLRGEHLIWLRVSKVPFTDSQGNIIGLIGTYQDVTDQKKSEESVMESKERLRKQIETLTVLGTQRMEQGNMVDFAREITESISVNLDISRVSIWEADEQGLNCVDLYEKELAIHTNGTVVNGEKVPVLMQSLLYEPNIITPAAQVDPRTKELTPNYLTPNSITSLMIYPIRVAGKLKGAISCEHTRTPRDWNLEEQSFVTSMLDLMTLKMEELERGLMEETIEQNQLITEQIIEKSREGVVAVDKNNQIMVFNQKAKLIFQNIYGLDLTVGMDWFKVFETAPEDLQKIQKDWEAVQSDSQPIEKEAIYGVGTNRGKMRVLFDPIITKDNKLIGVAVFIRRGGLLLQS